MKRLALWAATLYVVVAAALYTFWLVLPLFGLSTDVIRPQLVAASAREGDPLKSNVARALGYALLAVPPFGAVTTPARSDGLAPMTDSADLSCRPVALPVSLFEALGMDAPPGHDESCAPIETLKLVAESCRQLIVGK